MSDGGVVTWHHGLIARWWANFNVDSPEIDFFRGYVEARGRHLDLACGSGRLLVPWVASGLDVDVDAAPDMIAACREGDIGRALPPGPVRPADAPPSTSRAATGRS